MKLQVGVKILIQNDENKYLFIQRSDKMEGESEPHWDIPGGRIEPQESLAEALAREVSEETGVKLAGESQLLSAQDIFVANKDLHVVRLTYSAKGEGRVQLSDEHLQHNWWTKSEALMKNIDPYVRKVL